MLDFRVTILELRCLIYDFGFTIYDVGLINSENPCQLRNSLNP